MKKINKHFKIIFLVFLSVTLFACSASSKDIGTNELEAAFIKAATEYHVPGAVMAVMTPGGETLFSSYGFSNLETKAEMNTNDFFRIGSITKTYTSTAIMILRDRGLLNLEQAIEEFLPGRIPNGENITLKMLLQMRSGLSDFVTDPDFEFIQETDSQRTWQIVDVFNYITKVKEPDIDFKYCNSNFLILQKIIEIVSGQNYGEFIQKEILAPLGLTNTLIPVDSSMPEPAAQGYLFEDNLIKNYTSYYDPSWAGAAGYLIATAEELLLWLAHFKKGTLVTPSSRKMIFQTRPGLLGGELTGYGLGLIDKRGALGHGGNFIDYYTSTMFSYRDYDFVVLVNGYQEETSGDATDLFYNMLQQLFPTASPDNFTLKTLDNYSESARKYLDIPGMVTKIKFPNGEVWTAENGISESIDRSDRSPANWSGPSISEQDYFRVGSITKTFTATLLLILADQGLLSLNDTLESHLPGIIATGKDISIRMLMNHTSGIPDFITNPEFFHLNYKNPEIARSLEEKISYGTPLKKPDLKYSYSNTGYLLLGLIAEKVTGLSYPELIEEKILIPLKLGRTYAPKLNELTIKSPYAHGYTFNFNPMKTPPALIPENGWLRDRSISNWQGIGFGDIISTAPDIMTWLNIFLSGKLLSPAMQEEMYKYVSTDEIETKYGLGIEEREGLKGHDGDLPGFHSAAYTLDDYSFVVLQNGDSMNGDGFFVVDMMARVLLAK